MDALGSNASNLKDVILFLLPGFITILLFFYQIPDRKKSDLTMTVLSVTTSVVLAFLTSLFFLFLKFTTHLKYSVTPTSPYFLWMEIILSIFLALLLAEIVRSRIFTFINEHIFNVELYPLRRVWDIFFNVAHNTVVKIFLNDGTCYIGKLNIASNNPDDDVREIELLDPYYFYKSKSKIEPIEETESVLIQASAIASVEKILGEEADKLYIFPQKKKKRR
jgi:hypothetical protein